MVSCQSPGTLVRPPASVGRRRLEIGGGGVDGVMPGQHDWIVIVVELVREEVCAGEAVVLRSVMAVVLVSRDRMNTEAAVLALLSREPVVKAEQDGLAVAHLHELGRNGSVVSPGLHRGLRGQVRVKLERDRGGRVDAGILER